MNHRIKHVCFGSNYDYIFARFINGILYINDSYNKEKWGCIVYKQNNIICKSF